MENIVPVAVLLRIQQQRAVMPPSVHLQVLVYVKVALLVMILQVANLVKIRLCRPRRHRRALQPPRLVQVLQDKRGSIVGTIFLLV